MTVFGEVPAPAVQLATADPEGWAANVAAVIEQHLQARNLFPISQEPPIVGIADALLGVRPIRGAADYAPGAVRLAKFADAVNRANRQVYAYATECLDARRAVLVDWNRRSVDMVLGSEEWAATVAECAVVAAEAEGAEWRLARYERGLRRAIKEAEAALDNVDTEYIERLTKEIEAAGQEYSMPPETPVSSEFETRET